MKKNIIYTVIFLILVILAGSLLYFEKKSIDSYKASLNQCQDSLNKKPAPLPCKQEYPANNTPPINQDAHVAYFINNTYTNLSYNFQITIPDGWSVGEYNPSSDPIFIFYKDLPNNTLSRSLPSGLAENGTYIAVYPQGFGAERMPGKTVPSTIEFNDNKQTVIDYVLKNGSRWMTMAYDFKNRPESWNESGFIFGKNLILEKQEICERAGKPIDRSICDLWEGDTLIYSGTINNTDRKQIEMIISSFKFIP